VITWERKRQQAGTEYDHPAVRRNRFAERLVQQLSDAGAAISQSTSRLTR
jgi:hypothetical protein